MQVIISTDECNYKFDMNEKDYDLLDLYCYLNRDSYFYTDKDGKEFENLDRYTSKIISFDNFINIVFRRALKETIPENFSWHKRNKGIEIKLIELLGKSLIERVDV